MTSPQIRRLYPADLAAVGKLIQSRVDAGSRVALSRPVEHSGFGEVMSRADTYMKDKVFGLFREGDLRTISLLRPLDFWRYYFVMMMSAVDRSVAKPISRAGFNADTQALLDFGIRAMEDDGYYMFYSLTPCAKHWKRTIANPDRSVKGEYQLDVLEVVPAGKLPVSELGWGLASATHEHDMQLNQYRRIGGPRAHA